MKILIDLNCNPNFGQNFELMLIYNRLYLSNNLCFLLHFELTVSILCFIWIPFWEVESWFSIWWKFCYRTTDVMCFSLQVPIFNTPICRQKSNKIQLSIFNSRVLFKCSQNYTGEFRWICAILLYLLQRSCSPQQ